MLVGDDSFWGMPFLAFVPEYIGGELDRLKADDK